MTCNYMFCYKVLCLMLTLRRGQLTCKKLNLEGTELEVQFLEMIWNFEFVSNVGRKITTMVWLGKFLGKLRILRGELDLIY